MTARKYVINSKDRVLRRKARQHKAAENLQALIQEPQIQPVFNISKFRQDFENIVKNIDGFIRQLQTQRSFNAAEIAEFMSEKAMETKTLRTNLPRSSNTTAFKRELKIYEKMVLDFPVKLAQALEKNKTLLETPQTPVKALRPSR